MSNLVGAFSTYTCTISSEAKEAYDEAFEGFTGVGYSPVAVAQQVVSGMNYRFFTNVNQVVVEAPPSAAIVSIYKPLTGKAVITQIHDIELTDA